MPVRPYDYAVTMEPRVGKEVVYATHNYCDPTTWFGSSVRVDAELATDSGDGLTWDLGHDNVIDLVHGKIFDEDNYASLAPHGYAVIVKVDGVVANMRAPFSAAGGDYEANYATGKIVFFVSKAGSVITVDYSYATDSTFSIVPDVGFDIDIEGAIARWSNDFVMNDTVCFQLYGLASIFAPELGLPAGTLIPIGTTNYKTLNQLTSEASSFFPSCIVPAGGATRGNAVAQHAVGFSYRTIRKLQSAYGIELRVKLSNDIPMGGSVTTATFYCVVRDAA